MQNKLDSFFFGCARLQPKPMTSPATILPSRVTHYTIEAFGEKTDDFNSKLQWRNAKFYFENVEEPLEILTPNLRAGLSDPCSTVCHPIFNPDGVIELKWQENPYFSEAHWEQGLSDLFNVIRLHLHLDGTNGQDKLLKSTTYCREKGISAQWYCLLNNKQRDQLRQSVFDYLCKNPQIFDDCIDLLCKFGVYLDRKTVSLVGLHDSLSDFDHSDIGSLKWSQRWADIRNWWGDWQEDFFYSVFHPTLSDETQNLIKEIECKFKSSFNGQLIVEETMPLLARGLVWRIAQKGEPVL